jgi:tetratricopeptide (TPR) repeat protein
VELGWPVALAWAAMVGFGLWGKGMGGSPIRQACHISAFLLLAHGMLDKPLSLPPTSVLGVFFVGLLLRWRLPVRLVPPTGGRRYMLRGLGLLSVLAGGYLVSVMVWHGTLLRRGAIAEDAGMVQTAYEAYAAGAKVAPWDRTAHANAGICADRQLHRADLALPHLAAAFELEPNTAHINSNIGRALGRLKRHGEALPFFVRETELYPFDLSAWRDLFICGLLTDRLGDLPAVQDQLLALRLDAVEKRLARESGGDGADGEALARRLAAEFALSAEGGEPGQAEKALETAAALAKGLVLPGAEGGGVRGDPSQYTMLDVTFWQTRLRWRNVWLHCDRNSPGSLLEAWGTLAKDDRALGFAPFAESAGWQTLVVQSSPETVELRRGGDSYLVVPQTKKIAPGEVEQLIAEATLQRELGVSLGSATPSVLVRVGRLRLYERQQYLGYVLHTLLPETMPKLYRSPYAEMFAVRRRFEKARVKVAVRVDVLPE